MSYFPHAFKKVFVGLYSGFVTSGKPEDLMGGIGWYGFFDAKTWNAIDVGDADVADFPQVLFMGGSYHSYDVVGPYGGFQESNKSKPINPYYVHRFWKVGPRTPVPQVVYVGWDGTNASSAPKFQCGQNYSLRIDLKGAPAVRLLGHNFYSRFDVLTDCCADSEDLEYVDPIEVLLAFARQINADPIVSQFITADVITTDGGDAGTAPDVVNPDTYTPLTDAEDIEAAIGALRLTVSYVDTLFSNCAYDWNDYVGVDQVFIGSAELVDEGGNACPAFDQLVFTEAQGSVTAEGSGPQILRDLLLSEAYRQEVFHPSARRREVNGMANLFNTHPLRDVDTRFSSYYILYSVPRRSNPSGVYDNDQYLVQLSVPEGEDMSGFEEWMSNYLDSTGQGVVLEDLS